jgi:hypothetical protein
MGVSHATVSVHSPVLAGTCQRDCTEKSRELLAEDPLKSNRLTSEKESLLFQVCLTRRPREFSRKRKGRSAIDEAYHIGDALIFLREYPAENVAMDGRLQSENPKILETLKKITAGA